MKKLILVLVVVFVAACSFQAKKPQQSELVQLSQPHKEALVKELVSVFNTLYPKSTVFSFVTLGDVALSIEAELRKQGYGFVEEGGVKTSLNIDSLDKNTLYVHLRMNEKVFVQSYRHSENKLISTTSWTRFSPREIDADISIALDDTLTKKPEFREILLAQQSQPEAPKEAISESSFYLSFPPGNDKSPVNMDDYDAYLNQINKDEVQSIKLMGQSYSTRNGAKESLAKARAEWVKNDLNKLNLKDDLITLSYDYKNAEPESKRGVMITIVEKTIFENVVQEKSLLQELANSQEINTVSKSTNSEAINYQTPIQTEVPFYELIAGEHLKVAVERWVKDSGYKRLVWNVEDYSGQELIIPIKAGAVFDCEFKGCLSKLKRAYANAKPNPLHFDIVIKEGNKVVEFTLLNKEL